MRGGGPKSETKPFAQSSIEPLSFPPGRIEYPKKFDSWFKKYPRRTGKKPTLREWEKLPEEDKALLEEKTILWMDAREAARGRGVFVAEVPDPVRFIKWRRWEDEFEAGPRSEGNGKAKRDAILEQQSREFSGKSWWMRYVNDVLAGHCEPDLDAWRVYREENGDGGEGHD